MFENVYSTADRKGSKRNSVVLCGVQFQKLFMSSVESFPPRQASVASEYTSSVTLEAELSTPAAVAQRAAHQGKGDFSNGRATKTGCWNLKGITLGEIFILFYLGWDHKCFHIGKWGT